MTYFPAHQLSTAIRLLLRFGTEIRAASRPALTLPRKPRATSSTLRVRSGVTILLLLISKAASRLHIIKASRRLFPAHISEILITTTRMRLPQLDQTTLLSTAMRNMVTEEMPTTGAATKSSSSMCGSCESAKTKSSFLGRLSSECLLRFFILCIFTPLF